MHAESIACVPLHLLLQSIGCYTHCSRQQLLPSLRRPPSYRRSRSQLLGARRRPGRVAVRCAPSGGGVQAGDAKSNLKVGSPIVVVEAPVMLKTAASVPSLRHNNGQVKIGEVGRIMARKPKDVWAVRLAIGTYLLDGKFFSPLDSDNDDDGDEPQDE